MPALWFRFLSGVWPIRDRAGGAAALRALHVFRVFRVLPALHGFQLSALVSITLAAQSVAGAAPRVSPPHALPVADFEGESVSPEVRQVARWALATGDAQGRHLVLVDKRNAHAFVLDPRGHLRGSAPVLLGLTPGDHTVPGIGTRPLSQVRPEERTTPAGRFIAEPGRNLQGEDIVWVDYEAAVSMHRVRARVASERRLQRLASPTPADNRISYGCINVPVNFYEQVLLPAARAGAVIYVLPEVRRLSDVFGAGVDRMAAPQASDRPVGPAGRV